jgi:hypothetical protein
MVNGRKLLMVIIGSLFILFTGNHLSFAADSNEEYDVYKNFFIITGTEAQYDQMIKSMMNQYQPGFSTGVQNAIKKMDKINEKDKPQIQKIMDESINSFSLKLKEKLIETMPFQDLVKNVYIPVYKKYLNIDEIKEITKFYESETGKKFVSLAPTMMQDTVILFNQNYNQKLIQISNEISEAEFARMKQAIEDLSKK